MRKCVRTADNKNIYIYIDVERIHIPCCQGRWRTWRCICWLAFRCELLHFLIILQDSLKIPSKLGIFYFLTWLEHSPKRNVSHFQIPKSIGDCSKTQNMLRFIFFLPSSTHPDQWKVNLFHNCWVRYVYISLWFGTMLLLDHTNSQNMPIWKQQNRHRYMINIK